jgi:hypothetical protein
VAVRPLKISIHPNTVNKNNDKQIQQPFHGFNEGGCPTEEAHMVAKEKQNHSIETNFMTLFFHHSLTTETDA